LGCVGSVGSLVSRSVGWLNATVLERINLFCSKIHRYRHVGLHILNHRGRWRKVILTCINVFDKVVKPVFGSMRDKVARGSKEMGEVFIT